MSKDEELNRYEVVLWDLQSFFLSFSASLPRHLAIATRCRRRQ